MNIIYDFNNFLLNETLKTYDIDLTIKSAQVEIDLLFINAFVSKNSINNSIKILINDIFYNNTFSLCLDVINTMMINRFGWFPSIMLMINTVGQPNNKRYDENFLKNNFRNIKNVEITYEAKYDLESNVPNKLYHLSFQEFENKILKSGLSPKSGNKLSKHLDRIYVCSNIEDCKELISRMKLNFAEIKFHNKKNKINTKWIIYEIDTNLQNKPIDFKLRLFKDPNYKNGYYLVDNIPPQNIKIVDKES